VPALQAAGFDWLSLANNHVLDYEVAAFADTLAALDQGDIPFAGAGRTAADAWAPSVVTVTGEADGHGEGLDVALVACTDNVPEYAAGPDSPGVAWTGMDVGDDEDLAPVRDALERAKKKDPDLLVASLHWGPNMVADPAREYVEFGHWLVDRGVDLVHGHSAHNFQGVERYGDGLVLHDTGDFVDDYAVHPDLRNDRGFLFEVLVEGDGTIEELRLHPVEIDDCAVHRAEGGIADWCRDRMRRRSEVFGTSEAFERDGDELVLEA
jgi:poly-gamma-glutamate synthesis protein (capsule biosynthesis protein)